MNEPPYNLDPDLLGMLSGWRGALVAWLTGLWGAGVAYARSRTEASPWGVLSMVVHLFVNGFVTWLAWLGCFSMGVQGAEAAVISGLAGYLGVETLKPAEPQLAAFWARLFGGGK